MKYEDARQGYLNLWNQAGIKTSRHAKALELARKLASNKPSYAKVADAIGCPWWWIACVHQLESDSNFRRHLHNGDPLTARTVRVPAGRPLGDPPFTWEESALDALRYKRLDQITDWNLARCLYEWERYNGFGYVGKINSPYLWSFTTLEQTGKYVADHVWDPNAISEQCGAAALLKALEEIGAVNLVPLPIPAPAPVPVPQPSLEANAMSELTRTLEGFAKLAPTLAAVAGGPLAMVAVKALAEALGDTPAKPEAVTKKIEDVPLSALVSALSAAERLVRELLPAEPGPVPAPVPAGPTSVPTEPIVTEVPLVPSPPVNTQPTNIDNMLGGEWFTGWKTIIGVAIFVLAHVLDTLGVLPGILTPSVLESVQWLAGLLAGVGAIAKVERYIAWFKKPVPTVATVVTQVPVEPAHR